MSFPSLSRVFFVPFFSHRKIQNWNVKINKRNFSYYNHSCFHPGFRNIQILFSSVVASFPFLNLFVLEHKEWGSERLQYLFILPLFCNFHGKKVFLYEEERKSFLYKKCFLSGWKKVGAFSSNCSYWCEFNEVLYSSRWRNSYGEEAFHPSNSSYFIFSMCYLDANP